MANEFNHLELRSKNVKKAETFYKGLFGWKLQPIPEMHYTMFTAGDGPAGGMMQLEKKTGTACWVPYVHVSNIKNAVKKAKTLGAKVHQDVMEIPGYGHIAVLVDPGGAMVGLSQPAK